MSALVLCLNLAVLTVPPNTTSFIPSNILEPPTSLMRSHMRDLIAKVTDGLCDGECMLQTVQRGRIS